MKAWETKREQYLAEAHARARAGLPTRVVPPKGDVVSSVTCALGTFRVERGPAEKRPWRIVGPRGRVWGTRETQEQASREMHRVAAMWPIAEAHP